jgi:hypothetical protein
LPYDTTQLHVSCPRLWWRNVQPDARNGRGAEVDYSPPPPVIGNGIA